MVCAGINRSNRVTRFCWIVCSTTFNQLRDLAHPENQNIIAPTITELGLITSLSRIFRRRAVSLQNPIII
jgi:hypothetical protein